MKMSVSLVLFLLIPGAVFAGQHISLQAEAGHFQAADLDRASTSKEIAASLRLTKLNHGTQWAPAAYLGFYEREKESGRDNSFQFLIIKNNPTDDYFVAGYRIIESGEQVNMESVSKISDDSMVTVTLSIIEGTVLLGVEDQDPVVINTSLKEVVPYISVSSGEAEFEIEVRD